MDLHILKVICKVDEATLTFIQQHMRNKYLDRIMPVVTRLGDMGFIWIIISLFLIQNSKYSFLGWMVLITLAISAILGEGILKHIVKRIRPCVDNLQIEVLIPIPRTYSFPSGHTFSSFSAATILSVYLPEYGWILIALAVLIAFSRVYLYVHYPSDVVIAMIFGILCSKFFLQFYNLRYVYYFKNFI